MKKILTIQDISCYGQCSLTVALPVISAMGIETVVLPSAILSTHTGGFKNFTFRDLTEDLPSVASHWKKEHISFDGIYTGYIGSIKQIEYIKDIIKTFKKSNDIVLVDPACADNGKLYTGFNLEFIDKMKELCEIADYICPNITEGCYLAGVPYKESFSESELIDLVNKLSSSLTSSIVLTGAYKYVECNGVSKKLLGVIYYDNKTKEICSYYNDEVPYYFHGTGDIFASVFFGSLINGNTLLESCKAASDFVVDSIKATIEDLDTHRYGVHFEKVLNKLIK